MSFIYFRFNIEHDVVPKLVKIGGTKDYKSRSASHKTSSSCYIIVFSSIEVNFNTVETSIKRDFKKHRHYSEEYHYYEGMIDDIAKLYGLTLVTVCLPPDLDDRFSFVDKHIVHMIGQDYKIYYIIRPRQYQGDAIDKAMCTSGNCSLVLPTGTGKTLIMSEIATKTSGKVCIISPYNDIIASQADDLQSDEYQHVAAGVKIDEKKRVYHMSNKMFISLVKKGQLNDLSLVIADESHHVNIEAPVLYNILKNISCRIIGLTATPDVANDVFPQVDYEYKIEDAVLDGYLDMPDLQIVSEDIIIEHMNSTMKTGITKRGIIYFNDTEHLISWRDRMDGINGVTVCIDTMRETEEKDTFTTGTNNCLMMAIRRYTEGYNDVSLEMGVKMDFNDNKSIRSIIQMMGRLTRKSDKKRPVFMLSVSDTNDAYRLFINMWYELIVSLYGKIEDIDVSNDGTVSIMCSGGIRTEVLMSMILSQKLQCYSAETMHRDLLAKVYNGDSLCAEYIMTRKKIKGLTRRQYVKGQYVDNPEVIYATWWKGWDHYLGYDTRLYMKTKAEWRDYIKRTYPLMTSDTYDIISVSDYRLPLYPGSYYPMFSSISDELGEDLLLI